MTLRQIFEDLRASKITKEEANDLLGDLLNPAKNPVQRRSEEMRSNVQVMERLRGGHRE